MKTLPKIILETVLFLTTGYFCYGQPFQIGASVGAAIPTRNTDVLKSGIAWSIEMNVGGDSAQTYFHLAYESTSRSTDFKGLVDNITIHNGSLRVGILLFLSEYGKKSRAYLRPSIQKDLTSGYRNLLLNVGLGLTINIKKSGAFFAEMAPLFDVAEGVLPYVTVRAGFLAYF